MQEPRRCDEALIRDACTEFLKHAPRWRDEGVRAFILFLAARYSPTATTPTIVATSIRVPVSERFVLHQKTAIAGPNACGKSTIVGPLSVVLGTSKRPESDRAVFVSAPHGVIPM